MGIVAEVVNFVSCDQDVLCRWLQKWKKQLKSVFILIWALQGNRKLCDYEYEVKLKEL